MTEIHTGKSCPIERTLAVIGQKWSVLIIRDLLSGKKRFCELLDSLTGISPRMLSMRLSSLESDALITKRSYTESPPRVEYALTKRGRDLHSIIKKMAQWGDQHT
jgi:DNA-binding HxlR family transcriptional regulator